MSQVFNDKELLERVDNDWDFLAETVEMLNTDGRALMDQVRQAAAAGDATALHRHAHTLKGMISNFCAPGAQSSAFALEILGKTNDLAGAPAAVATLQGQLDQLIAGLNDFLSTRPA